MITFKHTGDFSKLNDFLEKSKESIKLGKLDKFGREGVAALSAATPIDSGLTADSWYYEITRNTNYISITFNNSNNTNNIPIIVMLQYGHGTGTGGWVEGRDFINPAIQPVFDRIADHAWKEVTSK